MYHERYVKLDNLFRLIATNFFYLIQFWRMRSILLPRYRMPFLNMCHVSFELENRPCWHCSTAFIVDFGYTFSSWFRCLCLWVLNRYVNATKQVAQYQPPFLLGGQPSVPNFEKGGGGDQKKISTWGVL